LKPMSFWGTPSGVLCENNLSENRTLSIQLTVTQRNSF
jgi:hypothetical protein